MPTPDETQRGPDGQLRKWQPDTKNLEAFNYLGPSSGFASAEEAAQADLQSGQGSWVPAAFGGGMPWWMKAFVATGLGSAAVTGLGAMFAPGAFGAGGGAGAGAGAAGAGTSAGLPTGLGASATVGGLPPAVGTSATLGAAPGLGAGAGAASALPSLGVGTSVGGLPPAVGTLTGLGAAPIAQTTIGGPAPTGFGTSVPSLSPPPKNTSSLGSTLSSDFIKNVPALAGLLATVLGRSSGSTGSNPASDALNGLVPQLTSQLTQLSQNDLQRRQMSDPLYEAVLRGAMGGLPVWMRGGSSINPPNPMATPSLTPPTTPKV